MEQPGSVQEGPFCKTRTHAHTCKNPITFSANYVDFMRGPQEWRPGAGFE